MGREAERYRLLSFERKATRRASFKFRLTQSFSISLVRERVKTWDLFRSRYASITLKLEIDVRVPAPFAGTRIRRVSKRRPKYKLYLEKILPYTIKYNRVVPPLRLTRDTSVSYPSHRRDAIACRLVLHARAHFSPPLIEKLLPTITLYIFLLRAFLRLYIMCENPQSPTTG